MTPTDQPPPDPAGDDVQLTAEDVASELRAYSGDAPGEWAYDKWAAKNLVQRFADQQTAALRAEMHAAARAAANEAAELLEENDKLRYQIRELRQDYVRMRETERDRAAERDHALADLALAKHANAEMSAIVTQARERIEALLRELKR
jgi:hypothetical protein